LDENITKDSLTDFPLATYAAEHWIEHALHEGVLQFAEEGMKQLFALDKHILWFGSGFNTNKKKGRRQLMLVEHYVFRGLHSCKALGSKAP